MQQDSISVSLKTGEAVDGVNAADDSADVMTNVPPPSPRTTSVYLQGQGKYPLTLLLSLKRRVIVITPT